MLVDSLNTIICMWGSLGYKISKSKTFVIRFDLLSVLYFTVYMELVGGCAGEQSSEKC